MYPNDDTRPVNEFLVRDTSCEGREIGDDCWGSDVGVQHVELHLEEFWMSTAQSVKNFGNREPTRTHFERRLHDSSLRMLCAVRLLRMWEKASLRRSSNPT